MKNYMYNATNLITDIFDERGVFYDVVTVHDSEQILAAFSVNCGPNVVMRFISRDDDNDVAARIVGLISHIPFEKRVRVMEACNIINRKIRFVKFYIDPDGDINMEYDFPVSSSDECIGEMAFEIFVRTMKILDQEYNIFTRALYTDDSLNDESADILKRYEHMRSVIREHMESEGN